MASHFVIRQTSVKDAEQTIALDRLLATDGRGMVHDVSQVKTLDEERRRIDDVYRASFLR